MEPDEHVDELDLAVDFRAIMSTSCHRKFLIWDHPSSSSLSLQAGRDLVMRFETVNDMGNFGPSQAMFSLAT